MSQSATAKLKGARNPKATQQRKPENKSYGPARFEAAPRRVWQLKRQNLNTKSFGFCHVPLSKSQKVQAEDPRVQAKTDKEPEMLTETARERERGRERERDSQVKVFCLRWAEINVLGLNTDYRQIWRQQTAAQKDNKLRLKMQHTRTQQTGMRMRIRSPASHYKNLSAPFHFVCGSSNSRSCNSNSSSGSDRCATHAQRERKKESERSERGTEISSSQWA